MILQNLLLIWRRLQSVRKGQQLIRVRFQSIFEIPAIEQPGTCCLLLVLSLYVADRNVRGHTLLNCPRS